MCRVKRKGSVTIFFTQQVVLENCYCNWFCLIPCVEKVPGTSSKKECSSHDTQCCSVPVSTWEYSASHFLISFSTRLHNIFPVLVFIISFLVFNSFRLCFFFKSYFQSPAHGSKRSEIQKPVFIVQLKYFLMYEFIPIGIVE